MQRRRLRSSSGMTQPPESSSEVKATANVLDDRRRRGKTSSVRFGPIVRLSRCCMFLATHWSKKAFTSGSSVDQRGTGRLKSIVTHHASFEGAPYEARRASK